MFDVSRADVAHKQPNPLMWPRLVSTTEAHTTHAGKNGPGITRVAFPHLAQVFNGVLAIGERKGASCNYALAKNCLVLKRFVELTLNTRCSTVLTRM
jgi:hypothetical protein